MKTILEKIDDLCIEQDRYGYTIPFLYKIAQDSGSEASIAEILKFLSKQKKAYIITRCKDLEEYIIGLHKREYSPIEMYESFGNLYYDQDETGVFKSFDELIKFMVSKYQIRIDKRTFSKNIDTIKWE